MSDRTEKKNNIGTVSVKLKPEIRDSLHAIADFRNRSAHFLMNEAISNYVEAEIVRMKFIKAGEASARHYEETGQHINFAEFNEWADSLAGNINSPLAPCHK